MKLTVTVDEEEMMLKMLKEHGVGYVLDLVRDLIEESAPEAEREAVLGRLDEALEALQKV